MCASKHQGKSSPSNAVNNRTTHYQDISPLTRTSVMVVLRQAISLKRW